MSEPGEAGRCASRHRSTPELTSKSPTLEAWISPSFKAKKRNWTESLKNRVLDSCDMVLCMPEKLSSSWFFWRTSGGDAWQLQRQLGVSPLSTWKTQASVNSNLKTFRRVSHGWSHLNLRQAAISAAM